MFGRNNNYCAVCGMKVDKDADFQRFGKHFCSQGHADQYVQSMQSSSGKVATTNAGQSNDSSGGCCG